MFAVEYPQAIAFLESNRLRHLVHLKFLHLYPDTMRGLYAEVDGEVGVLLDYPTALASKDASNYPETGRVYLPVASGAAAAQHLIESVTKTTPTTTPFVVKFCDPLTRDLFVDTFSLRYAKTVISYTISGRGQPSEPTVKVVHELDDAHADLYARNGYTRRELEHYFADGAQSFSIYEGAQPVCSCLTFRNFGDVWEIAGLHTLDHVRRKGYARQVVQAAVGALLAKGHVPRYQVESDNTPSIQLAESLGLTCCLRFEHYLSSAGIH